MIALTILIFAVLGFAVLKTTFSYLNSLKNQRNDDDNNKNEDEYNDKDEESW